MCQLFLFFHQMLVFQELSKMFFISFKISSFSSFCSKDTQIFVIFFPSFPPPSRFNKSNEKGRIYIMNCLAYKNYFIKYHQTWSGNVSLIKEFSWICFVTWRATGQLVYLWGICFITLNCLAPHLFLLGWLKQNLVWLLDQLRLA